jgi:hypothetical protein
MKNLFDRLDVLDKDVKQKYITNLTECNDPNAVVLGYTDWMLYNTDTERSFGGGFVYNRSAEGHEFWIEQQMKFNLLNNEPYDN